MIKQKEFECHLCDRVVQRIPKTVVAFGETFHSNHLTQYFRDLSHLITIELFSNELGLYPLKGVCDYLSKENGYVDGC